MKTVVLGDPPRELAELIDHRQEQGLDLFDEVWEGSYHMAPAPRFGHAYLDAEVARVLRPLADRAELVESGPFNLGEPGDYRVPDRGYHRTRPNGDDVYVETAALVVEILSPDDETFDKLPFYAAHGVDEILVVDPSTRRARAFAREGGEYEERDAVDVLGLAIRDLETSIRWP